MHHFVLGINFQILFVSLIRLASIHLLIHLSTYLSHHSCSLSLQAQNLLFQQMLPTLDFFYLYWTDFMKKGLDRTYHAHQFIFSFIF